MSTPTTTEALVLSSINGSLALRPVHLSALQPDEALIEIHATGICHTDLSCMNGTLPVSAPAVLGHEGAGVVLAMGPAVTHVSEGDKVLLSINHCRTCTNCVAGHPNYCAEGMPRNFGGKRVSDGSATLSLMHDGKDDQGQAQGHREIQACFSNFFGQSSFSRHAVVNGSCMVKVPSDTKLELFAPLGCGISTGAGSVLNTLNVQEGSTLAVFGVGSVGLSAIMVGKIRKAAIIVAIDLNDARLEIARKVGATHVVNGKDEDVVERVRQCCPEGVAYAVDCTGAGAVIETMMECLAIRGRAAQVGIPPPDKTVSIKILQHLLRGQEYVGCAGGDCVPGEMLPFLMEQQQAGRFPLEEIVSYYPIQDFARAFEDSRSGRAVKAVLTWT